MKSTRKHWEFCIEHDAQGGWITYFGERSQKGGLGRLALIIAVCCDASWRRSCGYRGQDPAWSPVQEPGDGRIGELVDQGYIRELLP